MKQSETTLKTLARRYRAVLIKCALINLAAFAVVSPARALDISSGTYKDTKIPADTEEPISDITVSGGTFDNVMISAENSLTITGGTFRGTFYDYPTPTPYLSLSGKDVTITDGTFDNGMIYSNNSLKITGGNFTDMTFTSNSPTTEEKKNVGDLAITGGTFRGEFTSGLTSNLNLSGGNFDGVDWWWSGTANDLNIDSNKTVLNLKAGKNFHDLHAGQMNISGDRGISLAKTNLSVGTLSGKATLNKDTFAGNFKLLHVKHLFGDKILYDEYNAYEFLNAVSPIDASTNFDNADLVLNGNSLAGIGLFAESISAADYGKVKDYADADIRFDDCWKDISAVRNKLTQAEIADSVGIILSELKKVDATTKKRDDLPNSVDDPFYSFGFLLPDSETSMPTDLRKLVTDAWDNGESPDWEYLEQKLYEVYNNMNAALDDWGGNVTVQNSVVTMNGTSGLINDSFKSGNLTVSNSTVNVNGNNEVSARTGTVLLDNSTLNIAKNAVLNVGSNDGNVLHFKNGGALNLGGVLNAQADFSETQINFQHENARIRGTISGTASLNFSDNYSLSALKFADGTVIKNITIAAGKTLDIGAGTLKADSITGGTISAILTDAAKTSAIIKVDTSASNVTLKLGMSGVSRDVTTLYKITDGTGFSLGDYSTSRYAVSKTYFDPQDAKNIKRLQDWDGGNLYILRLATASEAVIEDLEKAGEKVSQTQRDASKVLDMEDDLFSKFDKKVRKTVDRVNTLLDEADEKTAKQILREVAPDVTQSANTAASNAAKSVINVVQTRFGGFSEHWGGGYRGRTGYGNYSRRYRGRSGGDFESGRVSVWAQGMMNYAKLDKNDGFNAHTGGFAAGLEGNVSDDFKFGAGYAFASTDIGTQRAATDVDTHTYFVYGEYKPYRAYVNAVAGYGHSRYDEKTRLTEMESDYTADAVSAQMAVGYDFGIFSPEAALRFMNIRQNAYTDALGARLKKSIQNTWTGVVGAKLSNDYYLNFAPSIGVTPELKVAATYDFSQDNDDRTVVLPDLTEYRVKGDHLDKFGVEVGAGLAIAFGRGGELSLKYEGRFKKDYADHTGMVNLKVNF